MMTETVVTVQDAPSNNANNPRQTPTVKTDPGQRSVLAGITINVLYLKTIPGIIKLVQLVIAIIIMSCTTPLNIAATHWFLFVVSTAFIATLIWVFVYVLSIRETLKLPINWILTELLNTALITILYATGFIAQLSVWPAIFSHYYRTGNIAAGVFGIFNTIAYAAGTYFLYLEWKNTNTQ